MHAYAAALLGLVVVAWSNVASAETYHLRDDGTADQQAAALSNGGACDAPGAAMSIATHNASSFEPGDTITICGAITSDAHIDPPSDGSEGNPITYRGDDPNHPGSLEQSLRASIGSQIHIRNRHHLVIQNLEFRSDVTGDEPHAGSRSGIWIDAHGEGNTTSHIDVDGCSFFQTITGIIILSTVSHVTVTRCTFRDLVNSGLAVTSWPGDSANHPSYLTVGGSPEAGNTFVNVTRMNPDEDVPGGVPGQAIGTRVDDLVFSYNHVYAEDEGWGAGVYLNGVQRVLIEHNFMHDLDSGRRRPTITVKSDIGWQNSDVIIRANRIGPSHGGRTYITPDIGISVGNCVDTAVIYGNYVSDVVGMGIASNWGWHPNVAADGCGVNDLFIFSNVIDRTQTASGIYLAGCGSVEGVACTDGIENAHVTNNTLFRPVDAYDDQFASSHGIMAHGGGDHYEGLTVTNNIIDTPRDDVDDYVGLRIRAQDDLSIDYTHHHWPGQIPAVRYDGSDCEPCAWDSPDRPAGYGDHDTEGDPAYVGADQGDFALGAESPCRDSGGVVDAEIPAITIQGVEYRPRLSEGLDPRLTDWEAIPPVVHFLDQSEHGEGWERGAYVYPDSEICEFLSGIPCADGEYCEGGEAAAAEDAEICCVGGSCQPMTCENQGHTCCAACAGEELALPGCGEQSCCSQCAGDGAGGAAAGAGPGDDEDEAGCGCNAPGSSPTRSLPLLLIAALAAVARSGRAWSARVRRR